MQDAPTSRATEIGTGEFQPVKDAIIVAGGIGSRMLPASGAVPKEALPLVDVPILWHLAHEAASAGVVRLHFVISPLKTGLAEVISPSIEKVEMLKKARPDLPPQAFQQIPNGVESFIHIQEKPNGLGDAIATALPTIKGPFLVLLGDNILLDDHSPLRGVGPNNLEDLPVSKASHRLVEEYNNSGRPTVGLIGLPQEKLNKFGVVEFVDGKVVQIVEKPPRGEETSNLVLCGRYLFTSDTAELLEKYNHANHGELQSIRIQEHWMNEEGGLAGVELDGFDWYDSGDPLSWLQAQIDHALRRPDLRGFMLSWLEERLNM